MALLEESGDRIFPEATPQTGFRSRNNHRPRAESSALAISYPNSLNQRTPARSYYQRAQFGHFGRCAHGSIYIYKADEKVPDDENLHFSQSVRQETEQLASRALSDGAPTRDSSPPHRHGSGPNGLHLLGNRGSISPSQVNNLEDYSRARLDLFDKTSRSLLIKNNLYDRLHRPVSTLTDLIRQSPRAAEDNIDGDGSSEETSNNSDVHVVTIGNGIISQPHESSSLLQSLPRSVLDRPRAYETLRDAESQQLTANTRSKRLNEMVLQIYQRFWTSNSKIPYALAKENNTWTLVVRKLASCFPAVVLGLLLNILDALSYGIVSQNSYLFFRRQG